MVMKTQIYIELTRKVAEMLASMDGKVDHLPYVEEALKHIVIYDLITSHLRDPGRRYREAIQPDRRMDPAHLGKLCDKFRARSGYTPAQD